MNGTAATVAVGAGAQQQQSSPTNRGNSVAAVSPTRRQELPASDAGQSSSSLTKEICGSRCAGTSDSSTVNTADMSCADTDTGFGPANADHNTASASRCVSSDTALNTSQEASTTIDSIDSRASTPTPTPSLHSSGGIGGDDHDHDDSPSISSSASSPSSSRSGSHHSTASETPYWEGKGDGGRRDGILLNVATAHGGTAATAVVLFQRLDRVGANVGVVPVGGSGGRVVGVGLCRWDIISCDEHMQSQLEE